MSREPMWRRYARLFGANPRADMEDELRFHIDMRVQDYVRRGMAEGEARAAALARLGDLESVRQECDVIGEVEVRRERRRERLGELRQDVRLGIRMLRRAPAFTVVAVLTLALAIGATTAIFSVVHAVLLAPLPYPAPERLVNIHEVTPDGADRNAVSPGNFVDWRLRTRAFSSLGAYLPSYQAVLESGGAARAVMTATVAPGALEAVGVAPMLGRTLTRADARSGEAVVLVSHAFWRQHFDGEQDALGSTLLIDDVMHTVVGVLPAAYDFPSEGTEVWRVLSAAGYDATERRSHFLRVIGRLAPGVSQEQAQAEMDALAAALAREHPQHMSGWGVAVVQYRADLTSDARPVLLVLLGAVLLVLLIACGNLANLVLARGIGRAREFAVRGALGAGRARLTRQLVTESALVAVAGGGAGIGVALLLLRALLARAPGGIPLLSDVRLAWPVLAFAALVTMGSSILFALLPALRLARTDLQTTLRATRDAGGSGTRMRAALLIAEVAFTVVLLAGAGILVRSALQLRATDYGYPIDDLYVLSLDLPARRYAPAAQTRFYQELAERAAALPGVVAAAGTSEAPGDGNEMTFSFEIAGRAASNPTGREDAEQLRAVQPGYFETMRVPLRSGRVISVRDRQDAPPVAVINASLAQKHWPAGGAVGQRIRFNADQPWVEIIGVVGDARLASADVAPVPAVYIPFAQRNWGWMSWLSIVMRTQPDASIATLTDAMRATVRELDERLPMQGIESVRSLYGERLARRRFATMLLGLFALVALALVIVGLYGLLAYTVAQQRREIGVRMALGAGSADVVRDVVWRSLRLASAGVVLGLIAAALSTRLLGALVYRVSATDPLTFVAIVALVLLVAVLAAGIPAVRATRVSPLSALRN